MGRAWSPPPPPPPSAGSGCANILLAIIPLFIVRGPVIPFPIFGTTFVVVALLSSSLSFSLTDIRSSCTKSLLFTSFALASAAAACPKSALRESSEEEEVVVALVDSSGVVEALLTSFFFLVVDDVVSCSPSSPPRRLFSKASYSSSSPPDPSSVGFLVDLLPISKSMPSHYIIETFARRCVDLSGYLSWKTLSSPRQR